MPRPRSLLAGLSLALLLPTIGPSQTAKTPPRPHLEAVAETRLLMDGLTNSNYTALDRFLKEPAEDPEAWQFARGQALLIAETGNLLMLRPPKNAKAEDVWMARATDMREASVKLGQALTVKDLAKSRTALRAVANACNRCHESFRVETRVKVSGAGKD